MSDRWRYRLLGEEFGPAPRAAVAELLRSGDLSGDDEVCPEGGVWARASSFPELTAPADNASPLALSDDLASLLEQFETPRAPGPVPTVGPASGATGPEMRGASGSKWGAIDGREEAAAASESRSAAPAADAMVAGARAEGAASTGWRLQWLGEELGPFDWEELCARAQRGEIGPDDRVRRGPSGPWLRAGEIVGLLGAATQIELELLPTGDVRPVWHLEPESAPRGPFDWEALVAEAAAGRVTPRTRLREGRDGPWVRAATLPGLFASLTEARSVSGLAEQTARWHETPRPAVEQGEAAPAGRSPSAASADLPAREASTSESSLREPLPKETSAPPQDKWSQFFQAAEERDRRRRRRAEPSPPPGSQPSTTAPPAAAGATVPPSAAAASSVPARPGSAATSESSATAGAVASSVAAATVPPTAGPAGASVAAAAVPSRGPAPAGRARSGGGIRLPTLNLGGLWEKLRDLSGIDARSAAAAAGLVIAAAAIYLPSLLRGTPGVEYFMPIQQAWQQVLQKHERKAPAEEWSQLASELEALLAESQQGLAPVVASQGIKSPLAQRLLWMVDTEHGPTKAKGFLRRAIEGQGKVDAAVIRGGTSVMSEAAALAPRQ